MSNFKSKSLASSPSKISLNCFKDGGFKVSSSPVKMVRPDQGKASDFSRKATDASIGTKLSFPIAAIIAVLATVALITPSVAQQSAPEGNEGGVNRSQPTPSPRLSDGESEPGVNESGTSATVVTPNGDRLTVRSGPGASYAIIDSLTNGQTLQLSEVILGNWIQLLGGGWVYLPYLQR